MNEPERIEPGSEIARTLSTDHRPPKNRGNGTSGKEAIEIADLTGSDLIMTETDGSKHVVKMPDKSSRLAVPRPMNRAERRRLERDQGHRGKKAQRQRLTPQESEEAKFYREQQESQQRTIEAAQGLRQMTGGRMWLPGDK